MVGTLDNYKITPRARIYVCSHHVFRRDLFTNLKRSEKSDEALSLTRSTIELSFLNISI